MNENASRALAYAASATQLAARAALAESAGHVIRR